MKKIGLTTEKHGGTNIHNSNKASISLLPPSTKINGAGSLAIQPKLVVGHPNDPLEHEADRAADRVVSLWQGGGFNAPTGEPPTKPASSLIRRRAVSPEAGVMQASSEVTQQIQSAQGNGQPLPASLRPSVEAAFGMDFSGVRLHTDTRADGLNRELQARAFTTGQDIFFRQGEYRPGAAEGVRLLGHELGHVGQQESTTNKTIQRTFRGDNHYFRLRVEGDETHMADRSFEVLAHELAYLYDTNLDAMLVASRVGFIIHGAPYTDNRTGLHFWKFTPDENARRRGHIPVIAFTGSEFGITGSGLITDWVSDLTDREPGTRQFEASQLAILTAIRDLGGRVDVTGHSLGGALAQLTAATFPDAVRRVVTFQSPGISENLTRSVHEHNEGVRGGGTGQLITSTHYRAAHDIVDDAGEAHTEGQVFELNFDQIRSVPTELGRAGTAHASRLLGESPTNLHNVRVTRTHTRSESIEHRPVELIRSELRQMIPDHSMSISTITRAGLTLEDAVMQLYSREPRRLQDPNLTRYLRSVLIEVLLGVSHPSPERFDMVLRIIDAAPSHEDRRILLENHRALLVTHFGYTRIMEFGASIGYSLAGSSEPATHNRGLSHRPLSAQVLAPIAQVEHIIDILENKRSWFYGRQFDLDAIDIERIRADWMSISNPATRARARTQLRPYIQNIHYTQRGIVERMILHE